MKKLLGILVLGLLWCNISFADNLEITDGGRLDLLKTFLKDRDIPFKDGLWDWRNQRRKLTLKIWTNFGHTLKPEAGYRKIFQKNQISPAELVEEGSS